MARSNLYKPSPSRHFTLLAPQIVEGRQLPQVTLATLMNRLPIGWRDQVQELP